MSEVKGHGFIMFKEGKGKIISHSTIPVFSESNTVLFQLLMVTGYVAYICIIVHLYKI